MARNENKKLPALLDDLLWQLPLQVFRMFPQLQVAQPRRRSAAPAARAPAARPVVSAKDPVDVRRWDEDNNSGKGYRMEQCSIFIPGPTAGLVDGNPVHL